MRNCIIQDADTLPDALLQYHRQDPNLLFLVMHDPCKSHYIRIYFIKHEVVCSMYFPINHYDKCPFDEIIFNKLTLHNIVKEQKDTQGMSRREYIATIFERHQAVITAYKNHASLSSSSKAFVSSAHLFKSGSGPVDTITNQAKHVLASSR